ncbi:dicarboxylate/amino acid:cation symporter [Kushneria phyllosphaerae]|uniref:Proton/glutamate-aspartate symporter n=1 Tax=Kushneria phyllosphaerae TaxID=2100822 RepID=A0A2R8CPS3_9GAMM|nr:dicarboxylate/amino acid:cation symporter [Kushneria phyllosphaerae]SPJ34793.1 Proton/glutamate-aspartate symporter [Kushneria phyllosphaerae]
MSQRMHFLTAIPLWQKIMAGLLLGIIAGWLLGDHAQWLSPIGTLFINAIKMLIVPLVFTSLISGIVSMGDPAKMGRIGGKAVALYLITTAFAIALGMLAASILQPGIGVEMQMNNSVSPGAAPTLTEILVGLVPTNPISAMVDGNILQIIVFAIALGISLVLIGERGQPAIRVIDSVAEALYKLTSLIMACAPVGVFALIAVVAGQYGLAVLIPLLKVIGVVYLACILHVLVVYSGMLALLARLNPKRYLGGSLDAIVVAFSSASSAGTLPVSIRCAREKLGISQGVSGFVLPVGATINMDGTALYMGVVALFVAQLTGTDLTTTDYVMIVLTGTLASIGTAGVPGAGLIMLSIVFAQTNLPLEALGLIAGIDRILDMARTAVNVSGDLMVTTLVGKSEREIDLDIYNDKAAGQTF